MSDNEMILTLQNEVFAAVNASKMPLAVKSLVLENALMSAREAAEALAPLTRSEVVQVIGTKFVLYRQSHRKDKKDKIVLVEGKKRESVPQREP